MQILIRITRMAWRYRARLSLAYLSFFAAIGFSLLVPHLFGDAIDKLVSFEGGHITGIDVGRGTLALMALGILGASIARGVFDFARTYTTDSLSQKVSYDFRNGIYDKLQHLSFAYHDKEHTGNLMSKATADVEAVRRYVNMGAGSFFGGIRQGSGHYRHPDFLELGISPDQPGFRPVPGF